MDVNQIFGIALLVIGFGDVAVVTVVLRDRLAAAPGGAVVRIAILFCGLVALVVGGILLSGAWQPF